MSTFTPTLPSAPVSNRNISFILLRQMPVRNIYHGAIVSLNWDKINWVGSSCAFKMHLFTKKKLNVMMSIVYSACESSFKYSNSRYMWGCRVQGRYRSQSVQQKWGGKVGGRDH